MKNKTYIRKYFNRLGFYTLSDKRGVLKILKLKCNESDKNNLDDTLSTMKKNNPDLITFYTCNLSGDILSGVLTMN